LDHQRKSNWRFCGFLSALIESVSNWTDTGKENFGSSEE
jgi:hypothetical protein